MDRPKKVLVFCAHSDDQVIGAGGAIAKLAREGAEVRTVISSFGELSHPHLDPVEVRKTRVLESKRADVVLGGKGVQFLGLREGHFLEEFEERGMHAKLVRQIQQFRPDTILTHSSDDPLPDHRAVHNIVLGLHSGLGSPCEVYTFDIWNLFNLRKRRNPRLVVDISSTFVRKLDALSAFKSQRVALFTLLWSVYVKAILSGLRLGTRYAEVFYKVR
jgi:LmbE family N-acetylglucosaminyl deacetylase